MSTNQLDASKLIALFGHSVYHSDIDKAFEQFEVISPDKSKLKRYDSVNSASTGITFTFWYKVFYEKSINTPKSLFKSEDEEEVLLHEITFSLGKKWMCLLPYGLNWGDSSNEVIAKLDEKPFSKSKNYDGQNTWIFYKNDFKIMPVFDERLSLVWLRIWALQISDRKKIELKNDLKTQNKNIKQDNILELASLKNHKPTINWKIRMNEGDSIFTPIIIKGS
jgi:hypothetical protein